MLVRPKAGDILTPRVCMSLYLTSCHLSSMFCSPVMRSINIVVLSDCDQLHSGSFLYCGQMIFWRLPVLPVHGLFFALFTYCRMILSGAGGVRVRPVHVADSHRVLAHRLPHHAGHPLHPRPHCCSLSQNQSYIEVSISLTCSFFGSSFSLPVC